MSHLVGLSRDEQQTLQAELQTRIEQLAPIYHQVQLWYTCNCYTY